MLQTSQTSRNSRTRSGQSTVLPTLEPRRVSAEDGEVVRVVENLVTFKLSAAETGNAFSLVEVRTLPGGSIPFHVRHFEEKTIYVLDGTYVLRIGDETVVLRAGDVAFVPRGTPHSYRNAGPLEARMLMLATPGGIHEHFLEEIGEPVSDRAAPAPAGPEDVAKARAAAPKYGITLLTG
jgi:quercetin dioxygenase-like cupin family protein